MVARGNWPRASAGESDLFPTVSERRAYASACAVFGGTYVLGPSAVVSNIEIKDGSVHLSVPCHPTPVVAKHLISAPQLLPETLRPTVGESKTVARCIALTDTIPAAMKRARPDSEGEGVSEGEAEGEADEEAKKEDDTAIVIFPPSDENDNVVRAVMMGEGTGSCPAGQCALLFYSSKTSLTADILYLSTPASPTSDPKEDLAPYLAKLTGSTEPIFESYHLTHRPYFASEAEAGSPTSPVALIQPYAGFGSLTEGLDWEAEQGKKAYELIMGVGPGIRLFFEKEEGEGEEEEDL